MISDEQARQLLALARAAIASRLDLSISDLSIADLTSDIDKSATWLQEPGACFVTLKHNNELRGCIGSLEPRRSLLDDVEANACAAAFSDPRFNPLSATEFSDTAIEISLLSPMQPMTFTDEADALAQLRPGIDGIVFECGLSRSTFLPQVWEQLPSAREFIDHLKIKAGLPSTFWASNITLQRYTVSKFEESSD